MVMQFHPGIEYLYKFLESSQCICEVFQIHFFMVHVFCYCTDFMILCINVYAYDIHVFQLNYLYGIHVQCTCVTVTHFKV